MEYLEIDGARGEGGGQTVRTALTLSCITGRPVRVRGVRANRRRPGLAAQHLAAVRALQAVSGARVRGAEPGSTDVAFAPGRAAGGRVRADIGTAGSIALVLQAAAPLGAVLDERLELTVTGGTDVPWSPTMNYLDKIVREAFGRMGLRFSLDIRRRGYYPGGGGRATMRVLPSAARPAEFSGRTARRAQVLCTYSGMPRGRVDAQVGAIMDALGDAAGGAEVAEEGAAGQGASLLAYSVDGGTVLGADSLLDPRTGRFGMDAAAFAAGTRAIDAHLADMLVVPASTAPGRTSFEVDAVTPHLETNLYAASRITGCRYGVGRVPGGYRVMIEGSDAGVKQGRQQQHGD